MSTGDGGIRPFRVEVPQADLDDLQARLARVRSASEVPGPGPEPYGVSLAWVQRLARQARALTAQG